MAGSRPGRRLFGASVVVAASWIALGLQPAVAVPGPITLYSAQHQQVVDMLTAQFTKETGIAVRVHKGEGPALASQLLAEGTHSPADLFFTENSPELVLLDEHGLLAPVDPATLASAPDRNWIGLLARENVLAYNTRLISADALPLSLMDVADPSWKARSPSRRRMPTFCRS